MRCLESEAVELKNNVTVFINVYLCYKEEFIIHTARCLYCVQLFSSLKAIAASQEKTPGQL